jgi:hypothetical protein
LPLRCQDILSFVEAPKILSELGDSDDISGSVALETDQQASPDDKHTPQNGSLVLFNGIKLGDLVILYLLVSLT